MHLSITIDLGVKCPECGKGGAVTTAGLDKEKDKAACGLCMACVTKALTGKKPMKSEIGRAVRARSRKP